MTFLAAAKVDTMYERSWSRRAFYDAFRVLARFVGVVLFELRCYGRGKLPSEGGVLVCANHQSYIDPVLAGLSFDRRMNYLARRSLFRFAPFRWLIEFLDAIPLELEGIGVSGLKESLRRLRRGEMVLIFPEGSRTFDGSVSPLMPGFCLLARRARVALLPVGIDGAFDAWPRTAKWPRLSCIRIVVGEPISAEFVQQADDLQVVAELERRIRECQARARAARRVG